MRKTLVPVLLLATVALSTSNFIPILSMNEFKTGTLDSDNQQDNIFSDRYRNRIKLHDIFNVDIKNEDSQHRSKYSKENIDLDQHVDDNYNSARKNDNYNVQGYRKEQWHNYPRQLDRLNKQFYEIPNTDKRNLDPDDPPNDYSDETGITKLENTNKDIELSGIKDNGIFTKKEVETAAALINPFIVLKIHLDCLKQDTDHRDCPILESSEIKVDNPIFYENNNVNDEPVSDLNIIKVKREDKDKMNGLKPLINNKKVSKRIFSLWSRLQSLNQRGHELHHRRHLYALYGLPDSDTSGVLTAETRATFMRPPGSPLRWG